MGNLKFNGVSTKDLGVVIQTPPVYEFPNRRYNIVQIEGKNGDLVIDKNAYDNVIREYSIASIFRNDETFVANARALVDWLVNTNGYGRLEDTYEPDYFRLAMYRGAGQLPNINDKATGMVLRFECKPQRFLKSGEVAITYTESTVTDLNGFYKIENKTQYIAFPEINIKGKISTIEIRNGNDLNNPEYTTIFEMNDESIRAFIIDSELQDVYTTTSFINNKCSLTNGFPKLYPGNNWIKITFEENPIANEVNLYPTWWVL